METTDISYLSMAVGLLLMALVTVLRRRACPWEAYEKIERND